MDRKKDKKAKLEEALRKNIRKRKIFQKKNKKNLNTNGQLKIKEIVNQLNKKFKNKMNLDIHLNEDRVIYYS